MKKRLFSLLVCLALVVPFGFLLTGCGKAKPESIAISGVKTEFVYLDDFAVGEDATVEVKMSKGNNLSFNSQNLTYNAEAKVAEANDYKIDYSAFNSNALGEYEIKVIYKANQSIVCSYKVTVVERPFADEEVTAEPYAGVYDGLEHTISVSSTVEDVVITYSTDGENYAATAPTFKNVGEYDVYFKVSKSNYAPDVLGSKKVTITQKEVGLNWGTSTFVYDGEEHIPTCSLTGVVSGDVCTVTVSGEETNIGTYTATVTAISNSNYKLPTEITKQFVINPKPLAKPAIAGESEFVYIKDTAQSIELTIAVPEGAVGAGQLSMTNAGSYAYTISLSSPNYIWADNTSANIVLNWKILKRSVAVPSVVGEFVYDKLSKQVNITGFDETLMTKEGTERAEEADVYNIKFALIDNQNYYWSEDNISVVSGQKTRTWEIARATVDASEMEWDYTQPFTYDGTRKEVKLVNVPTGFEPIYTDHSKINAGTYLAYVDFRYDAKNYNRISIDDLTWIIDRANPTYSRPEEVLVVKTGDITLADVDLSAYEGFSWVDETTVVSESGEFNAKFTPSDTNNYNEMYLKIYVNVTDPAKLSFVSYDFIGSNYETTKDIALSAVNTIYDGNPYSVGVYVDTTYTTGNAADATITYNGQSTNPTFTEPGNHKVVIKVTKEGYNDLIIERSVVISKRTAVLSAALVVADGIYTIDDKLSDVYFENVNDIVTDENNGTVVYGRWEFKESNSYLLSGEHQYEVVFVPSDSLHYEGIETTATITAGNGLPLKSFTIDDVEFTIPKGQTDTEIYFELEYGQTATFVATRLIEGNYIYNAGSTYELVPTAVTLESNSLIYDQMYYFVIGENDAEARGTQRVKIYIVQPTHLESIVIKVKENSDIVSTELKYANGAYVQGDVVEISITPEAGYTYAAYMNDILIEDISAIELLEITSRGQYVNNLLIIVKDSTGKIVAYVNKYINYEIDIDKYQTTDIANLSVEAETNEYFFVYVDSVTFTTNLNTSNFDIKLYRENLTNGSYENSMFDSPVSLVDGLNVFKAVLTTENAAKIVKEFVIYKDNTGVPFEENRVASNSDLSSAMINTTLDTNLLSSVSNIIYLTVNNFDINNVVISDLPQYAEYEVEALNDEYILVIITYNGDTYLKVFKLQKMYFEDAVVDSQVLFADMMVGDIVEVVDGDEIETSLAGEFFVITANPAASVSTNNENLMVYNGKFIRVLKAMEAEEVIITVTSADGSATKNYTITLTVEPMKMFGITPVKVVEGDEVRGTELTAGITSMNSEMPEIVGDLKVTFGDMTANAVDFISNYTIFNESGNVWAEGDGDKYIKVDLYTSEMSVYGAYDGVTPSEQIDVLEGALLKIVSENGAEYVRFYIESEMDPGTFMYISATLYLVEEIVTDTINLKVKKGAEVVQEFNLEFNVLANGKVIGDYFLDAGQGVLQYLLAPNAAFADYIELLSGSSFRIEVTKTGNFDMLEMVYAEQEPTFREFDGSILSFMAGQEPNEMAGAGLMLTYNAGTPQQINIILMLAFTSVEDMGM